MRVRLVGVVAAVATVALAVFAATGVGEEGSELRSFPTGYSTERSDLDRVETPSGSIDPAALGQASKKKAKVKLLFFETDPPVPVGAGAGHGEDLLCPRGKVVTGYFLTENTTTFLGASAPTSARSWLVGVTNVSAAPTSVIFGVVCATGVK